LLASIRIPIVDPRTFSLISEGLLAVFLATFFYQGRMVCLEQRGYARHPGRAEMDRMRRRLEELLELS
jgi:hypothetical protein